MDAAGCLTMSSKELNRLEILGRVLERRLTPAQAASQLGLSVRQVERWRQEYNTFRPHSALGYRPPAPEAVEPKTALGVR